MKAKGHLKKKLRKKLYRRLDLGPDEPAVVVCVGDKCAARSATRASFDAAKRSAGDGVRVACIGCLKVCKKGPIVALLPEGTLYRRAEPDAVPEVVAVAREHTGGV